MHAQGGQAGAKALRLRIQGQVSREACMDLCLQWARQVHTHLVAQPAALVYRRTHACSVG